MYGYMNICEICNIDKGGKEKKEYCIGGHMYDCGWFKAVDEKYYCRTCLKERKMDGLCASNEEESFDEVLKKVSNMTLDLMKKLKPGSIEMEFCLNFIEAYNNHGKYHDK